MPEQLSGCLGDGIGLDHQDKADKKVQEDDEDIDDLAEGGFAVDQIKLECLPEGVRHGAVSLESR